MGDWLPPNPHWADFPLALGLLILAAWISSTGRDRSAVIGFTAFGLLVALAWVRLGAIDVALTEAALGGGLAGVLLFIAAARLGEHRQTPRPALAVRLLIGLLCLGVAGALAAVVWHLPSPAPNLVAAVAEQQHATELGNPVAAVLIGFRAVDTLLESVVVALAVIVLWSFGADRAWGERPRTLGSGALDRAPDPSLVLLGRLLPPLGLVVGVHLFWTGADHPGGPFQGGAVLAAMAALIWLARLGEPPPVTDRLTRVGIVVGPLLFLLIGLAGVVLADGFLDYPEGFTKPLILLIEAAKTLSVAVALALLMAGPPALAPARRGEPPQNADRAAV
jgi:multisubunit Na+/H+ antiporter MnhB subunit